MAIMRMQVAHKPGVPDGVPALGRGRHRRPEQGGCFMEVASLLAGERWGDRPRCTHRVLADIARRVNDRVSDQRRSDLVEWVPRVVGANRYHPLVTASLAAVLARRGLELLPGDEDLRWAERHARRRTADWASGSWWRRAWLRVSEPVFRADGAARRVPSVVSAVATRGDDALAELLDESLTSYETAVERLDREPAALASTDRMSSRSPGPVEHQ